MQHYDLNLLRALDALLATGSVTEAAARMHLSTPAMSHTLARIRETFGDPILVRAGRKLVPTARAVALAEPLRALLEQAQALRTPAPQGLDQVKRHFVLRAPEGIAVVFGAPMSQALASRMPLASLQFLPEAHLDPAGLREGRIDLDIGSFRAADPQAETQVLSEQPLVGAARRDHALLRGRGRRTMTLADFVAARQVDVSPRTGEISPVDAALAAAGLRRQVMLQVPSVFTALIAASRSDLVACAPERTARAMGEALGLTLFSLPVAARSEPLRMAWHPRHGGDPAHAWLRECLRQVFRDSARQAPAVAPDLLARKAPAPAARRARGELPS